MRRAKPQEFGYEQKGNRYFWRVGAKTYYNVGFTSRSDAEFWLSEMQTRGKVIEWRAGWVLKWVDTEIWMLVNRKGETARTERP